jgi:CspA family cold shock protein
LGAAEFRPCLFFFLGRASNVQEFIMASGKVKWFDNKKGFGFIAQNSGQDVFVHHTSITGAGFKTLNEGDEVSFDVIPSDKGLKAQNVQRVQVP